MSSLGSASRPRSAASKRRSTSPIRAAKSSYVATSLLPNKSKLERKNANFSGLSAEKPKVVRTVLSTGVALKLKTPSAAVKTLAYASTTPCTFVAVSTAAPVIPLVASTDVTASPISSASNPLRSIPSARKSPSSGLGWLGSLA